MYYAGKYVDFDRNVIIVRQAEGSKDRVVTLPMSLVPVEIFESNFGNASSTNFA